MTNKEIFAILRPIIMRVTGVPECILADPNAQAPKGAYCSIRPRQGISERGQANITTSTEPDRKIRTNVRSQIICRCDINFYRGDAMQYAELLKECHKRPDVTWKLFKHHIGWGGTEAVNNLTALQSSNFEQRAQITVRLLYETLQSVVTNNIEHVETVLQDGMPQKYFTDGTVNPGYVEDLPGVIFQRDTLP